MKNIEIIQDLHRNCTEIDKTLFDAKKMISSLKKYTGRVLEGMNGIQKMLPKTDFCPICFENPKKYATNCGHLVCQFCKIQMESVPPTEQIRCAICRGTVTQFLRVYL